MVYTFTKLSSDSWSNTLLEITCEFCLKNQKIFLLGKTETNEQTSLCV